jgi:hypothetical protein
MPRRRSQKRSFLLRFDPDQMELANEIAVSSSPVSRAKYETDVLDQIDECSPFKCNSTPQDQLIAQIVESTPIKREDQQKYETNPDIEILSPIRSDPYTVEAVQTNDSRYFQQRKERRRTCSRKSLFHHKSEAAAISDTGPGRLLAALHKYLAASEKERNGFFREADDISTVKSDSSGTVRNHMDIEIVKTDFTVFGKSAIDGRIVKVTGWDEDEAFEMEDQRIRVLIDESLGNKFASHLESGHRIRIFDPFTLIRDHISDNVVTDFFFIRALDSVPDCCLQSEVVLEWDCPCRVTAVRVKPDVLPEDCFPNVRIDD